MVVSLVILFGFQKFYKPARPTAPIAPPQEAGQMVPAETQAAPAPEEVKPIEGKETLTQTEKFSIVFSDAGGAIKSISLKDYNGEGDEEYLLCEALAGEGLFSLRSDVLPGLEKGQYQMNKGTDFIEYSLKTPEGLEVIKRYTFYKSFNHMDLRVRVKNLSSRSVTFSYDVNGP